MEPASTISGGVIVLPPPNLVLILILTPLSKMYNVNNFKHGMGVLGPMTRDYRNICKTAHWNPCNNVAALSNIRVQD